MAVQPSTPIVELLPTAVTDTACPLSLLECGTSAPWLLAGNGSRMLGASHVCFSGIVLMVC